MHNQEIRRAAASAGFRLWELAEALGIADTTLSKKLRKELSIEEKERILGIIEDMSQKKGA